MKVIKHKDKWYLQSNTGYKEILLSTDTELQKDSVQAIDDNFLEWFVKNPSCEKVEIEQEILKLVHNPNYVNHTPEGDGIYLTPKSEDLQYGETLIEDNVIDYKIIIPKEEPKLTNVCIKCGVDLYYADNFACQEHPKNCKGIHLSEETLKERALKEETKQDKIMERFISNAKQQETLEEFIFKVPFDYNIKPKEVIDMCMKEQENIILTFRLGNFIDMINSLSDDTEKNRILKSVFNNRDGELLLESYKSMKSHYEK